MNDGNNSLYMIIRERIITLQYKPGQVLNETDTALEFNVSRTPVREVFKRLELEKYISIIPKVGVQVSLIDFKYYKQALAVKKELKGLMVKMAITNIDKKDIESLKGIVDEARKIKPNDNNLSIIEIDERFDKKLREIADNKVLTDIIDDLHLKLIRLWHYMLDKITNVDRLIESYESIIKALEEKDEDMAVKSAEKNVEAYIAQIRSYLL